MGKDAAGFGCCESRDGSAGTREALPGLDSLLASLMKNENKTPEPEFGFSLRDFRLLQD